MQVEEKNRQLNEDAETIEEKNELQTGKKKHRKNNFAAGMAVGAAAAIMGCSLAGIYFSRHYRRQQHHLQSSHRIRRPSQMS